MKLEFPLYVENIPKSVRARLLFSDQLEESAPLLEKVLAKLRQRLQQWVEKAKTSARQDGLREMTFWPEGRAQEISLQPVWKKRSFTLRMLVYEIRHRGRRWGYLPRILRWFDYEQSALLQSRAEEVLVEHWRLQEAAGETIDPLSFGLASGGKAWVEPCSIEVSPAGKWKAPKEDGLLAWLDRPDQRSGSEELAEVGRCLDHEVGSESVELLGRQAQLEQLSALMVDEPRVSVALIGPRQVGKSYLTLSLVAGRRSRRSGQFWLIEPGRLVAGMSLVGQWESRWNKILRHMRARNHVLVISDLVGFLSAGISRDSSLNAAQLLKTFLERAQLRVIAELTSEAWHLVRQRDRGLADYFRPLHLKPSEPDLTRRILLQVARRSEALHGVSFGLDALRAVYEVADRYLTLSSFPGKGANLIGSMAARYRGQRIGRQQVLEYFQRSSGLTLELLDSAKTLDQDKVEECLRQQVIGQPVATRACAEVVSLAKAGLNVANKPLASLLFVGPTGVGKSECAKALATYMFGDPSQLLRLDLNEFVGEDSLARLLGTFERPQGLLTEAARRQPFAVLLLDEVEKAHPRVLQLLLQLLGDGRLSDGRGRVADFSQMIIILTSNLGADQELHQVGIRRSGRQQDQIYRRAAENFFTPELFNRLDRVVPFRHLNRPELARLAQMRWQKLLARDGLVRRQTLLSVEAGLLDAISELSQQRGLGARALKREVERKLAGPVAEQLARLPVDVPTWIHIGADLQVEVSALQPVPAQDGLALHLSAHSPIRVVEQLQARLQALQATLIAPQADSFNTESIDAQQLLYFERKQSISELWERAKDLRSQIQSGRLSGSRGRGLLAPAAEASQRILASSDISQQLQQLYLAMPEERECRLAGQLCQLLLDELQLSRVGCPVERVGLEIQGEAALCKSLRQHYLKAMPECELQLEGELWCGSWAGRICEGEVGLHLFLDGNQISPLLVRSSTGSQADSHSRVVRLYHSQWGCLDVGCGLFAPRQQLPSLFLLARLWVGGP
jgi:ATP-dependent Clp protease ATP-binding subunit ClpC